uniref:Uncharacterized protein n=1 Tax=Triticum urartu TaxID=4572 RepID=A0A8R7JXU6_TRIUA
CLRSWWLRSSKGNAARPSAAASPSPTHSGSVIGRREDSVVRLGHRTSSLHAITAVIHFFRALCPVAPALQSLTSPKENASCASLIYASCNYYMTHPTSSTAACRSGTPLPNWAAALRSLPSI